MTRLPAVFLAVAALGTPQAPEPTRQGPPADPERGVIAVLRRDGVAMPFAAFRGRTWSTPWPVMLTNLDLPIRLEDVPERWWGGARPQGWTAWLTNGRQTEVAPQAPVQFPVHCERRLGLRTNHQPLEPPPPVRVEPFPKDGILATPGIRLEPVEAVPQESGEWGRLAASLIRELNEFEDREISHLVHSAFHHPVQRPDRHSTAVQIEAWYRARLEGGVTVSYVEAVRRYAARPEDEGCGLETVFGGWVIERGEGQRELSLGTRVTYCDRVGVNYMMPFGRTRLHGRDYWIAQLSGWESEWYVVLRLEPERVRLEAEVLAGRRSSCP